jgi:biotin transport system substrate-specific component
MATSFSYSYPLHRSSWVKNLLLIVMASLVIATLAPLSIQLPFTPIPFTLGAHLCLIMGILLGPRRGALAVLAYLFQGAMGLPVFAMGASGFLHLVGPRAGYLLGYLVGTYVAGTIIERLKQQPTPCKTFFALACGNALIFFFGACQLSLFIGLPSALLLGVAPFLVTDLVKLLLLTKGLTFCRNRFQQI